MDSDPAAGLGTGRAGDPGRARRVVPVTAAGWGAADVAADTAVLRVNEVFGPTVQGEGPATGRHCLFVRLALCNLRCTWCDTAYTWAFTATLASHLERPHVYDQATNAVAMTVPEVLDQLRKCWPIDARPTTVVVSGGEPMLQQRALIPLAAALVDRGHAVHVETAGTIPPVPGLAALVELFVVSPKLAHSGNQRAKRFRPGALGAFADLGARAAFKFVVMDTGDLAEVDDIVRRVPIPDGRVMVMPEGITVGAVVATGREIADAVLARGWGLSLRNHVMLWADVRGR